MERIAPTIHSPRIQPAKVTGLHTQDSMISFSSAREVHCASTSATNSISFSEFLYCCYITHYQFVAFYIRKESVWVNSYFLGSLWLPIVLLKPTVVRFSTIAHEKLNDPGARQYAACEKFSKVPTRAGQALLYWIPKSWCFHAMDVVVEGTCILLECGGLTPRMRDWCNLYI